MLAFSTEVKGTQNTELDQVASDLKATESRKLSPDPSLDWPGSEEAQRSPTPLLSVQAPGGPREQATCVWRKALGKQAGRCHDMAQGTGLLIMSTVGHPLPEPTLQDPVLLQMSLFSIRLLRGVAARSLAHIAM